MLMRKDTIIFLLLQTFLSLFFDVSVKKDIILCKDVKGNRSKRKPAPSFSIEGKAGGRVVGRFVWLYSTYGCVYFAGLFSTTLRANCSGKPVRLTRAPRPVGVSRNLPSASGFTAISLYLTMR